MSVLATIAIAAGTLILGGLGAWFLKTTRDLAAVKAEAQCSEPNGMTAHQLIIQQIQELREKLDATAKETDAIMALLQEWEKHYWLKMLDALKDASRSSVAAAQASESLYSLAKSGALASRASTTPHSSGD